MQKWIVERKFGRDDEISLHGDHWKRLGRHRRAPAVLPPPRRGGPGPPAGGAPPPGRAARRGPVRARGRAEPSRCAPSTGARPTLTPIRLETPIHPPPSPPPAIGFAATRTASAGRGVAPRRVAEPAAVLGDPRPRAEAHRHALRLLARGDPRGDPPLAGRPPDAGGPGRARATRPPRKRTSPSSPGGRAWAWTRAAVEDADGWDTPPRSSKAPWVAAFLIVGAAAGAVAGVLRDLGPRPGGEAPPGGRSGLASRDRRRPRRRRGAEVRERERRAKEELVAGMAGRADAGRRKRGSGGGRGRRRHRWERAARGPAGVRRAATRAAARSPSPGPGASSPHRRRRAAGAHLRRVDGPGRP